MLELKVMLVTWREGRASEVPLSQRGRGREWASLVSLMLNYHPRRPQETWRKPFSSTTPPALLIAFPDPIYKLEYVSSSESNSEPEGVAQLVDLLA